MKAWVLLLGTLALPAHAELPGLTPSQQAQKERQSAAERSMLEHQMRALAEVQVRIARHYRSTHPQAQAATPLGEVREPVEKGDVPKSATQPLGMAAAPHTPEEDMPQAEAHSRDSTSPR